MKFFKYSVLLTVCFTHLISSIPSPPRPQITIFVHGSILAGLSGISLYNVTQDNLNNTYYKRVMDKLRTDQRLYCQDQQW